MLEATIRMFCAAFLLEVLKFVLMTAKCFFVTFYTSKVRRHASLSKDTKQGSVSRLFFSVFTGFFI